MRFPRDTQLLAIQNVEWWGCFDAVAQVDFLTRISLSSVPKM